ncbi:hypothetical protein GE061_008173 [Apolygus lucorum]|uniref:Uncharacterized protein n=1 Tax=Apolygus lucorum TaxID=248454 RepID=A0A8S9WSP0_APOLU|nr:hypothetical protein GE061_008173 [Apolygus lucorum]
MRESHSDRDGGEVGFYGYVKITNKTTPGGSGSEELNSSPGAQPGVSGHSCSGGPEMCHIDIDQEAPLLRLQEEGEIHRERSPDGARIPVDGRRCNRSFMMISLFLTGSSVVALVLQVYGTSLVVGSTVNPPLSHIDVRLTNIETELHHTVDDLHIICRILTKHDECREMVARMHNKTMHSGNGNTGRGSASDPNPPSKRGEKSDEMEKKVSKVGPLDFDFNNQAAKAVQALITHPLPEAASNQLGMLSNHALLPCNVIGRRKRIGTG